NLEVTEQHIQQQVYGWVMRNAQHQMQNFRQLLDKLYANEYFMSSMKESALEEVVFQDLIPRYTVTETEATAEVFDERMHHLYHEVFGMGDHDHGPMDTEVHAHEEHSHEEDTHNHPETH